MGEQVRGPFWMDWMDGEMPHGIRFILVPQQNTFFHDLIRRVVPYKVEEKIQKHTESYPKK